MPKKAAFYKNKTVFTYTNIMAKTRNLLQLLDSFLDAT